MGGSKFFTLHSALFTLKVEQPEVGLVVPDAELSVVGERVAEESSVVGGTGEGDGLVLGGGIDDGVYAVAKGACGGVEINAVEVVAELVK